MREKKTMDRDPDFYSMTAEEIHEFLVSQTPDMNLEEIEAMNNRVYPRIMARIQQESQGKEEKLKRKKDGGFGQQLPFAYFLLLAPLHKPWDFRYGIRLSVGQKNTLSWNFFLLQRLLCL